MLLQAVLLSTLCTALSYKPNIIIITADDIVSNTVSLSAQIPNPVELVAPTIKLIKEEFDGGWGATYYTRFGV